MKYGKFVKAFYTRGSAKKCPCGTTLKPRKLARNAKMCGKKACEAEYQLAYSRDRRAKL